MTPRGPFIFLVLLLAGSGIASALFRHYEYGMPFLPGTQETLWQVEAKIEFRAQGGPTQAIFTLPPAQSGFEVVSENAVSAGYGFAIEERRGQRRAHWSKRDAQGDETLYYKLELVQNGRDVPADPPPPLRPTYFDEPYQTAAATLLAAVLPRSADGLTLAQQLVREINVTPKDQNVSLLLDRYSLEAVFTALLGQANVPARSVQVLVLEDGRRRQSLINLVQVWQGDEWHLFNPLVGPVTETGNLLLWQASSPGVLEVQNATRSRVTFSIISQTRPALALAISEQERSSAGLSLYSLPIEEQSMFKLIMLLPIGALVVVILRVIVGLKTSGTFMPVLIALAFLQTELIPGVLNFILVVAIGLLIRSYLSSLNLLLVARIATLVIVVVAIMSIFSVLSYRIGLDEGLTITFFPMIILAWTIERMSILWEEDGPREVLIQGSGSLFVAVMAFLLMDLPITRHLAFNFPELHLVVLAVIMLLGRYTGYRLSELRRFAPLARSAGS
jgi:hypothetical protein